MKKQRGFLILAFIMVLGITGCGTAQSGSSDDGSVTLEIFNIKTETAEQMDALVEDFEKDHPQIKINLTTVGGGTDATAALQSKFSSGDEPDIFMLGGLADTQIWQHKLYDLGETTLAKQAIEGTLEGATLDETVYGLPMNIEGYGWLINQDIFKQAGIDSGSINSFEAFEEAVQLLDSKKDELGLQGVFGFSGAETWVSSQYSSNFLAPEFENSLEKTYQASELSVDYAEQMKNYTDLVIKYNAQPMEAMDYSTSVEELFASEKVAIIHQGNWIVPTLDSLDETFTKEKLGILPMQIEASGESNIVAGPAWYWGVNKDKDQAVIDASIEFLTWMYTDEQAMTAIVDEFQFIPAYTNFSSEAINDPLSKEIYTYLSEGKTVPWVHNSYPDGFGQNIFGVQIQAYAADRISWEEFIDTLQTSWTQERK